MPAPWGSNCIKCGERLACDGAGCCGHCHWVVHAEVEEGLYRLKAFLAKHLAFTDWLIANGRS